ncbi:MAG: phosphoribosylformylglycinamidine synthase I [Elusimicrobia bacterium]|nr:phosphoribosylformylglycinamidine synthase I [Elusimicrobiota bacterium]
MKPAALVIKAPGTNCDQEALWALSLAGARAEILYFKELQDNPSLLHGCDLLFIPGGFSYGDYLGSGKLFALFLQSSLGHALRRFVDEGKTVIGVCNGFQILVKMGLLPGNGVRSSSLGKGQSPAGTVPKDEDLTPLKQTVSLTHNNTGRFECRWVTLRFEKNSIFAKRLQTSPPKADPPPAEDFRLQTYFELPIANGEGRFVVKSRAVLKKLQHDGLVFMRYHGGNPNGSTDSIAGITNARGNVIGLMPHPERFCASWQYYDYPSDKKIKPWGLEFLKAVVRSAN